mmetsp:Transcript_22843/g.57758  ORF Transcript_22843/g.57758 Transcript_22843/m.57758 type:complete len:272 (+) Transcript_22843:434-1249(+)
MPPAPPTTAMSADGSSSTFRTRFSLRMLTAFIPAKRCASKMAKTGDLSPEDSAEDAPTLASALSLDGGALPPPLSSGAHPLGGADASAVDRDRRLGLMSVTAGATGCVDGGLKLLEDELSLEIPTEPDAGAGASEASACPCEERAAGVSEFGAAGGSSGGLYCSTSSPVELVDAAVELKCCCCCWRRMPAAGGLMALGDGEALDVGVTVAEPDNSRCFSVSRAFCCAAISAICSRRRCAISLRRSSFCFSAASHVALQTSFPPAITIPSPS